MLGYRLAIGSLEVRLQPIAVLLYSRMAADPEVTYSIVWPTRIFPVYSSWSQDMKAICELFKSSELLGMTRVTTPDTLKA